MLNHSRITVQNIYQIRHYNGGPKVSPGNPYWRRRLSTVDLLIKLACCVKKEIMHPISKADDLNLLVQGVQLYWAFPFSKCSMVCPSNDISQLTV